MSKVITFSRTFPAYHPKAGQPTYFVEHILAALDDLKIPWTSVLEVKTVLDKDVYSYIKTGEGKKHTIRAGNRWKVGDKFSPRVWSDKPYNSKQVIIAPDIEIKKIYEIGKLGSFFTIDNKVVKPETLELIAKNDGLEWIDFHNWFIPAGKNEKWLGQIICWSDDVNY